MTTDNPLSGEHTAINTAPDMLPREPLPHAQKFRVAIAVLVGVAVAAIAIAVTIATHGSGRNTVAAAGHWSSWAPDSSGNEGVSEIADHIAPYYRMNASQQLDVITPISVAQATAADTTTGSGLTVAVNTTPSSKSQSLALLSGKTVAYNICGLGPSDCQLAGTPSTDRMLLMRREALELALYTFKYITNSENVLAVLPPGKTVASSSSGSSSSGSGGSGSGGSGSSGSGSGGSGSSSSGSSGSASTSGAGKHVTVAVLFVRKELEPWLDAPLSKTLQSYPPVVSELPIWGQSEEAGLVDQITARGLFSSQIESQQEGGQLLVLSPLPPQ